MKLDKQGEISKWKDVEKLIKEHSKNDKWVYRGESNNEEELCSSFDKGYEEISKYLEINHAGKPKKRVDYEASMFREFKRTAQIYLERVPQKNDFLEWMSLARHYGVPSRMVDFTHSLYIALFFAFQNSDSEKRGLWAVNLTWLKNKTKNRLRSNKGIADPKIFHKFFVKGKKPFVVPVKPELLHDRLMEQQGLFLAACDIKKTFWKNLISVAREKDIKENVKRYELSIPKKVVIEKLRYMNINSALLFPGFEGFCRSIKDYFYLYPDFYTPTNNQLEEVMKYKE